MNKGGAKHYSLLLQDDTEGDGFDLDEEDEMLMIMSEEDGLCALVGEDDDDEEDDDDDSDETEIFNSGRHRGLSNEGAKFNGQIGSGRNNEYHLLNNDGELKPSIEAPLATIWTPTPMSPVRRACFIASIMFGILVVSMFLWTLPCDVQPCEGDLSFMPKQWFIHLPKIGSNHTTLVHHSGGGYDVVIGYYKILNYTNVVNRENISLSGTVDSDCNEQFVGGNETNDSTASSSSCNNEVHQQGSLQVECGLLFIEGENGYEKWRIPLEECPHFIHCDMLDVTGDDIPDCLLLGRSSLAIMIEPSLARIYWHLANQNGDFISPLKLGLPIAIPDTNGDGIRELVFPGAVSNSSTVENELHLVSGKTGELVGSPYVIEECSKILRITDDIRDIEYSCLTEDGKKHSGKVSLASLIQEISSSNEFSIQDALNFSIPAPYIQPMIKTSNSVNYCEIVVLNQGKCPSCRSTINIERMDDIVWSHDYGFQTIITDWKPLILNGQCYGVLLKVWRYNNTTETNKTSEDYSVAPQRTTRSSYDQLQIIDKDYSSSSEDYSQREDEKDSHASVTFSTTSLYPNLMTTLGNSIQNNDIDFPNVKDKLDIYPGRMNKKFDWSAKLVKRNIYNKKRHMSTLRHGMGIQEAAKDFYEHPTIHQHNGKQTSALHENDFRTSQQLNSSTSTVSPSPYVVPLGFKLQHLQEDLVLILHNMTDWGGKTLTTTSITQLCNDTLCVPSTETHRESILVEPTRDGVSSNVFITTTTFTQDKDSKSSNRNFFWYLQVFVKKIIIYL